MQHEWEVFCNRSSNGSSEILHKDAYSKPSTFVSGLLKEAARYPTKEKAVAFAPANVALCKYWGKRDNQLNLPVTNSLSVSLGSYGAKTTLIPIDDTKDSISLNGHALYLNETVPKQNNFIRRLLSFLDLFRNPDNHHYLDPYTKQSQADSSIGSSITGPSIAFTRFRIETETNIPVAAGLASSAAGFAALVLALADLYSWTLDRSMLSVLARLGSGSASRSLWHGFVEWEKGHDSLGLDSFAHLISSDWYDFRIGLLIMNANEKSISSREAMNITMATSQFYQQWPERVETDLQRIKTAILDRNFDLLGETAESNALCMHALMQTAKPPIVFCEAATIAAMHKIWQLRKQGLRLYFTQDAGPNLKLLYLAQDEKQVLALFPDLLSIAPMQQGNIDEV